MSAASAPSQPPSPLAPVRPTVRFLLSHPAHFIALGWGSGLSPFAPGTVGTLWAWVAFLVMQRWFSAATIGWIILASLPIGWWACTVAARNMRVADPGSIVWDEVVAFWIILWLVTPASLLAQIVAFALFRYFDAAKPGPVRWADGLFKQRGATPDTMRWSAAGFGILFDDLVAAFCTVLVIALWRAWWW
ncbi:phosphatidylglycerophosphatase A [Variovorax sp. J22R133]|uniref:phosphatidylglycerophosphatase A family protein n=1 Tax=Variovorax brevis TaxID=3053503 RepID=UPI0025767156|nr:phosphatidylglycerophosphatase A [Variovorax sp. J22R133]MDM0115589.1 phosphatidylglycerophosphatase A [Variovorax sp. J22R133]